MRDSVRRWWLASRDGTGRNRRTELGAWSKSLGRRCRSSLLLGSALCALSCGSTRADAPLDISYNLTTSQRVSINIYNAGGQIVRELLHGAARTSGSKTEQWDGRDDSGNAAPVGTYTWKMLSAPGFSADYITNPGSNYPVKNTDPFSNQAVGDAGGPRAIAVDANNFYVSAPGEGENSLMAQSLTGNARVWSRLPDSGPWSCPTSLTTAGGSLWSLYGSAVYRHDPATGIATTFGVAVNNENPSDMSAGTSDVVLSYAGAGIVRWVDYTGAQTKTVSVPGAGTVDEASDGTVYVMAGTSMLKIAPGGTVAQPFISTGLTNPRRAAVNPTNGDVYIIDGISEGPAQVKRFNSSGVLQQTYGAAAGRKYGLYNAAAKASFRGTADIAVDTAGAFWVAEGEAAPRRVAKFNVSGTWQVDWYGGQVWAPWIAPEPDNPSYVWIASHWGDMIRAKVDYTNRSWSVDSIYQYKGLANGLIWNHMGAEDFQARLHNGTLYLCRAGTQPCVIKVDRTNRKLIPVVVSIGSFWHDGSMLPAWINGLGNGNQSFLWTDANGDGQPLNANGSLQPGELTVFPGSSAYTTNSSPDPNLNWLTAGGSRKFSVTSWNSVGAPVYGTFPDGEPGITFPPRFDTTTGYDDRWSDYVFGDDQGNIWGGYNSNVNGWGTSSDGFVARYNPNGTLAWQSGRMNGLPGSTGTLRHIYGIVNNGANYNCLVVGRFSNEWQTDGITPIYVYDQDGLYAGQVIGKPLNTNVPTWRYGLGGEALAGTVVKDSAGNVDFFANWINENRVYRITGWNGWQRASGTITVSAGYTAPASLLEVIGPNSTGTGLYAQYWQNWQGSFDPGFQGTPVITRNEPLVNFTANVNNFDVGSPTGYPYWSARWTGTLVPRRTGWHMFQQGLGNNSWNEIWVNGIQVNQSTINSEGWPADSGKYPGRTIWLQAGTAYPIKLEYRTWPVSQHGVSLQWAEPETATNTPKYTVIPTSQLNPTTPGTGTGLKAEYYNGTAFNTQMVIRTDPTINFNWSNGAPADSSLGNDNYSIRWTGKVQPAHSETYTFTTTTDDGVRLWVNNQQLIDKWIYQGATGWTGSLALTAGQQYDIKMEYFEGGGNASAKLEWQSASQAKQVIPQTALFPAP